MPHMKVVLLIQEIPSKAPGGFDKLQCYSLINLRHLRMKNDFILQPKLPNVTIFECLVYQNVLKSQKISKTVPCL